MIITDALKKEVIESFKVNSMQTTSELAIKFNICTVSVGKILTDANFKLKAGRRKTSKEVADKIEELYKSGMKIIKIEQMVKLSGRVIREILADRDYLTNIPKELKHLKREQIIEQLKTKVG